MDETLRIAVVGGGLAGLTAANVLADAMQTRNCEIHLVASRGSEPDGRTTALLQPSIELLEQSGLWEAMAASAAPLRTMRLIDGSNRLIRAPVTEFHANEIGLDAFGYNVPNNKMAEVLKARLADKANVSQHDASVERVEHDANATLHLSEGEELPVDLVVAADGRNSICRRDAGIDIRHWSYPQTAMVTTFVHTLPHGDVSTEFHRETGPFTQVPLPQGDDGQIRSSLVWVIAPGDEENLRRLTLEELSQRIETTMQSLLGKVTVETAPQFFPLSGLTAHRFAARRTFLVGEAAHAIPPIGAQGFNLGLRDIAALAETLSAAKLSDFTQLENAYHRSRLVDIQASTAAIDVLNRSLLTDFLPVQMARSAALTLAGAVSPLRKGLMQLGMGRRKAEETIA